MKAIQVNAFGGPEVLQWTDVPELVPGAGQVLVTLHAIGVNPVETYLRSGSNPALPRPYTPGTDAAGLVAAVGSGVTLFQPGARVYLAGSISGTYAQQALCRVDQVYPLPESLSFVQGAALNIPYATAWRALFQRAAAKSGETVLIHGASGAVGTAATQLAKAAGLKIIGTAGTERGRELVRAQGAQHVLDHRDPAYGEAILALTNGRGVEIILEMLANVNLAKDLTLLSRGGRVIVIGSRGKVEVTPRDLMTREADVRGLMLFNATPEELASIHGGLRRGMEDGVVNPIVGREFPLAEAARAHVAVLEPGAYGKIILRP